MRKSGSGLRFSDKIGVRHGSLTFFRFEEAGPASSELKVTFKGGRNCGRTYKGHEAEDKNYLFYTNCNGECGTLLHNGDPKKNR